jgi:Cu(I)/Ag(I) efflux system membrane fusion protein
MYSNEVRSNPARDDAGTPQRPDVPPLSRWQKFRLIVKVVELRLRFIALMAGTALVFAYWDTLWNYYEKYTRPAGEVVTASAAFEYFCPMHPSVIQDQPANCPICGMPLSKRMRGEEQTLPDGVVSRVQLAPFRVVQGGIRTTEASYAPLTESLTTVGTVSFDERRFARISSRLKGMSRVESLAVNFTGTPVKAGEILAEVYNPELYQAVRELLLAQQRSQPGAAKTTLGRSLLGEGQDLVSLGVEKLKLWGITQEQVSEILRSGKADYRMPILAPIGGVVVRKNIVEGQYLAEGEPMFEIADLSHVWILAQVYEDQIGRVRVGQQVEATVEAYPGQVFKGTVAFLDPALNPTTRTLGVRYDLENPSGKLQPGMFATVNLRTSVAETPIFQTHFAASPSTHDHADDSGRETVQEQEICPVTRAKLGSMGAPIPVQVTSRKVWVCCAGCPDKLKAEPGKYLARLEHRHAPGGSVLSVPETAVIDTGERKLVYVETEPGVFEGRVVVLGPRINDRYPVLEGLSPGETVAAAGAFLIDAESRLNQGSSAPGTSADPFAEPPVRSSASHDGAHRH